MSRLVTRRAGGMGVALRVALVAIVAGTAAVPATADIATARLRIEGMSLRVITDPPLTTGVDMPAVVQTEFGGKRNDEAPAVEGLLAVAELTGPGLDAPIRLVTAPGHAFQIPGLPHTGEYLLQNIRLVNGGDLLQYATPAAAVITVADLLQTKVNVRQLTPDELRARGINLDGSFDVYEYSFTFLIDGQEVIVPFPVIIDPRTHEARPVPTENPYHIPDAGLVEPPRWTPPEIIPTEFVDEGGELPEPAPDPLTGERRRARPSIPAAIVIPNNLAVLHQFFAVGLMVSNGAPEGSAARLEDVHATIRIPTALRTSKTTPAVSFGQPVPIVEPTTGVTFLVAQARGEAEWILEGLQPGTHRIDFDLRATLKRDGQPDVAMRAAPSAAVVIHDPRFNITFAHPATVRRGIDYSTHAFVTNLTQADQTIAVTNEVQSCSENPSANVCRLNGSATDLLTIPAGDMRTIEYRLRSNATGSVFATAGSLSPELEAAVRLELGVSESGIPLSPATLVLPHYAQYVPAALVDANLQLLGLGYSVATAPLNATTARFPRVIKTDVFARAVDLARAGQRIFIAADDPETTRSSLMHLTLDLLGNGGPELREWDALRRSERSGRNATAAIIRELESVATSSPGEFVDAFAEATAHRPPFLLAVAHGPAAGERPYAVALKGRTTGRRCAVPNEATEGWVRELPFADLSRLELASRHGEIAVAARWVEDLQIEIIPRDDGPFDVDVVFGDASETRLLRATLSIAGVANQPVTMHLTRGDPELRALLPNGGIAAVVTATPVEPPPLQAIAARQDLYLDPDGHKVSIVYNRPVSVPDGADLRSRYTGEVKFNRDGVVFDGPRAISAAALQADGRTVNLTFDHALHQNAAYVIRSGVLRDPVSTTDVALPPIDPRIDNDRPAAVLFGRVLKADNTAISGAEVVLRQYVNGDSRDPSGAPQWDQSDEDGAFLFENVWREAAEHVSGAYRLEAITREPKRTVLEGAVRLPGRVHFVNLQFLGRGAADGRVTHSDGSVVAGASVVVGSTMFDQFRSTISDQNGYYRVDDLPVGPLTFSAVDSSGNVTHAASEIATPGQLITQNLIIVRQPFPGTGRVHGTVRRSDTGAVVQGARVGVYSQGYGLAETFTGADGRFDFERVPSGLVSVLAAEWSLSREAAAVDFDLRADEVRQLDVQLSVRPAEEVTSLQGEVWRENVLQPGQYDRVAGAVVKTDGFRTTTADANGAFIFENVPVTFSGRSITAYDPVTQRVRTTELPTLVAGGPNAVSIFIGASDRGTGTVRVRVSSASGAPASGQRVIVPGFPPRVLPEIGNGVYELTGVPVGVDEEIWVVPSESRPTTGADPRPFGDQTAHGTARVAFNGHIAALTLRYPGDGTVRVRTRADFDLISPVSVTFPVWDELEQQTSHWTIETTTAVNGQPDWAVFERIPALVTYSATAENPAHGSASASAVLAYDGDVDDHVLQLSTLSSIRGVVYAIDGRTPVSGATVRIDNGRFDPGPVTTGMDGSFEFVDQPPGVNIAVVAQSTQNGVFRTGFSTTSTPAIGGAVNDVAVVLRKRGNVEGRVVYRDYRVFDPDDASKNVPDDTPEDLRDNAPAPLARFYLRELDFPNRSFGTPDEPMQADADGRFALAGVFVGALRASGWDPGNEDTRGDWTGRIEEEAAAVEALIAVGDGGVGAARITVVDPNQNYAAVLNAEVALYRNGTPYDLASTDATGSAQFHQLPAGSYATSAYSKALGRSSSFETLTVVRDETAATRLELEFSGSVDGTLTDPENAGNPVPGAHVRLTASSYQTQSSTDVDGFFIFSGVREGTFALDAKDSASNRRAHAERSLSILDPHRTVVLELEPTETLHLAVYLPDDTGGNSGVLAPPVEAEVTQRCPSSVPAGCDYQRKLQGNPLEFAAALESSPYSVSVRELGGAARTAGIAGVFPTGSAANPLTFVWPAYGDVRVTVRQSNAPSAGAKVTVNGSGRALTLFTDSGGVATARGVQLGAVYVTAVSLDGKLTGSASVSLTSAVAGAAATIDLGSFAGITGSVAAEAGGASVGTRVIAEYGGAVAELRTDANGRYSFFGIPASPGGTAVALRFIGPDDSTVGGRRSVTARSGDGVVDIGTVRLDATPPRIEAIVPADGATFVSRDTSVTLTFSEPLADAALTASNFQLIAADGSGPVATTVSGSPLSGGRFAVTLTWGGQALRSNTLYRVVVTDQVADRTGHRLAATRGFTFTTSDYAEPRVQRVVPAPNTPIHRESRFEFTFNEPIDPGPWQSGGAGEARVLQLQAPGGSSAPVVRELAATAFVDPVNGLLLVITPDEATPIEPESFYRVMFSGVRDLQGNVLDTQTFHFFSFDEIAPHLSFVSPPADVQLVSGSEYEIRVDLRNGSTNGTAAHDVSRVEYFLVADDVSERLFATPTDAPFATRILAPHAAGAGGRLTIAAQATDLSGNRGPKTQQVWQVMPNGPPGDVAIDVLSGPAYPTSTVNVQVQFEDEGTFAVVTTSLTVPLQGGGTSVPVMKSNAFSRPPDGEWPRISFAFAIPAEAQAGSLATITATVSDLAGLTSAPADVEIEIATDSIPPSIVSFAPADGTRYSMDDSFFVEAVVREEQSSIRSVTFTVNGDIVSGDGQPQDVEPFTKRFRSAVLRVPPKDQDTRIPVEVAATDIGGNTRSVSIDVIYEGLNDPDAPLVTWLCPIDRAAIPAGVDLELPLRVRVDDVDATSVSFSVAGTEVPAVRVGTTSEYVATARFTTPPAGALSLNAVARDAAAHETEASLTIDVIEADVLLRDPTAITADDAPLYEGRSVALVGPDAVLAPQVPLRLANLLVLNGARVETLPSTIAREFRLSVEVAGTAYIDCDSGVDVSERGYAGGWASTADGLNADAHGRTRGNTTTGGADDSSSASHGGAGGSNGDGKATNRPYGSLFRPTDLGAGGGGHPSGAQQGAAGGGAIAIRGSPNGDDTSRIVVAGTVASNGGDAVGSRWRAGAGGSIWIEARSVIFGPGAVVIANGGNDDASGPGAWGGGGGRISVRGTARLDVGDARLEAFGGRASGVSDSAAVLNGGAGTVLLRHPGSAAGDLLVADPVAEELRQSGPTPVAGIGSGSSTAVEQHALTDATRKFDAAVIGQHLTLDRDPSRRFAVIGISNDGSTLFTDPADGSLVDAASSQHAQYRGAFVFDSVTASGGALLVFDEPVLVNGVRDDRSAMTITAPSTVVLHEDRPTLTVDTVPENGGAIIRDASLAVSYAAESDAGVERVTFSWSPVAAPHVVPFSDYPLTTSPGTLFLPVPVTTGDVATLIATARDRAGRISATPQHAYTVAPNAPPKFTDLTVTPALSVHAGREIVATITATDDVRVESITFDALLDGGVVKTEVLAFEDTVATGSFRFTVDPATPHDATLQVRAAVSDGYEGRSATTFVQTIDILPDEVPPQISVSSPTAEELFTEGGSAVIPVRATVVDGEVAVKEVFARIGDGEAVLLTRTASASDVFAADLPVPPVDGFDDVLLPVFVSAADYAGNAVTAPAVPVYIRPLVDPLAPSISWACSAEGAMYPPGFVATLRVQAKGSSANNAVQSVRFTIGEETHVASAVPGLPDYYQVKWTIPDLPDGSIILVRADATSAGGNSSDVGSAITIVRATAPVITSDLTIDAANAESYGGKTVVVQQGTVTIDTLLHVDRLLVLGGTVTHRGIASQAVPGLQIGAASGVFIACDASIDVSGRGYASNATYPGETLPGGGSGGSHLGAGGLFLSPVSSTFGSVYRPREAGGGPEGLNAAAGGGVVKIDTGTLVLEGGIRANGRFANGRAGAGGSVWLAAETLRGTGVIEARGANGDCNGGSGGGGAVALEYTGSASSGLLTNLDARGGSNANCSRHNGGAGTVYVRGPSATYGELTVDNKGSVNTQPTALPSLGAGTAQAGSAGPTLVTNRTAPIPPYFEGHWIEISNSAGAMKGTWRIASVDNKTITLTVADGETVDVQPGDRWQGVYRFDTVHAPSGGWITGSDPVRLGAAGRVTINGPLAGQLVLNYPVTGLDVTIGGNVTVASITADRVLLNAGVVVTRQVTARELTITSGAKLTVPHDGSSPQTLILTAGLIALNEGGEIDVSGRGYGSNRTYPGASLPGGGTGGSHIGVGGLFLAPLASTFGSVYRPLQAGGGPEGFNAAAGGGVVQIDADVLENNGAIRANGTFASGRAGGGGSIFVRTANVLGSGVVEARGANGDCNGGSGGGGAISLAYSAAAIGTVLSNLDARGGANANCATRNGGAGTVYVSGPESRYGDLRIDNKGAANAQPTALPSLGRGVAQASSAGSILVTDRSPIPAYFAGHWVEIVSPSGVLKGTWRIESIANATVSLMANAGESIDVAPGDSWQGIYRFDAVHAPNGGRVIGEDPVRIGVDGTIVVAGPSVSTLDLAYPISGTDVTITGNVRVASIDGTTVHLSSGMISSHSVTAGELTVAAGGVLTLPDSPSAPIPLQITADAVIIEAGGAIDVTGRGYGSNRTWPGATLPGGGSGGSHLGAGGLFLSPIASTFGSVYRPLEAGGGPEGSNAAVGGGAVSVVTGSLTNDGAIRANGTFASGRAGAGGSIWVRTASVAGAGVVEARGANGDCNGGSGGGGAIAIEYTSSSGTALTALNAAGGSHPSCATRNGGTGTVFVKGPGSEFGDLLIDNKGTVTPRATELPSLGSGIVQAGSAGRFVVTNLPAAIPAYFLGHWVEVSNAQGSVKGVWRIANVEDRAFELTSDSNETIEVTPGDAWQGVYRFDTVQAPGGGLITGADPVRIGTAGVVVIDGPPLSALTLNYPVAGQQVTVRGNVNVASIRGERVRIESGATATHTVTATELTVASGGALTVPHNPSGPYTLTVIADQLTIEPGASIDVSGRGYGSNRTYAGATLPGGGSGGSHLGVGGLFVAPVASTFGSVYRPSEAGAGPEGNSASAGGGVVRIEAKSVTNDGAIRANGTFASARAGAGGSVWLTAISVGGAGTIQARGANGDCNGGSGGGGAIAIETGTAADTLLEHIDAAGGAHAACPTRNGGAGTIYIRGPDSTYGDLVVDNGGAANAQPTLLPALGSGIAQQGSGGTILFTDRAAPIPAYFVGHWIEIADSGGSLKGTWRISSISDKTVELAPNDVESVNVVPGDRWQGVYRFDAVIPRNGAIIAGDDPVRNGGSATPPPSEGDAGPADMPPSASWYPSGSVANPALLHIEVEQSDVVGGRAVKATLLLAGPAPADGAAVALTSSDTSAAIAPLTIVIPPGAIATQFDVQTLPVAADRVVEISASCGTRAVAVIHVRVKP